MTRPKSVPENLVVDYEFYGMESIEEILNKADSWRAQKGGIVWSDSHGGHWLAMTAQANREFLTHPARYDSSNGVNLLHINRNPLIPIELDGSEHAAYRQVLNPLFSPARMALLEGDARVIASALLAKLVPTSSCDVGVEFARPLASSMFLRLVDWPLDDREVLESWVEQSLNPVSGGSEEELIAAKQTATNYLYKYCSEQLETRRTRPAEDMTSVLLNSKIDGRPLSETKLVSILLLLLIAGLDTTQSVLSRSLVYLAQHPDDQQYVRDHPEEIPMIIEEFLRWSAPTGLVRTAACSTMVEGVQIQSGDKINCSTQIANRDPAEFESPHDMIFTREANRHLAFGLGPHRCIGAAMARMVLAAAVSEFHSAVSQYSIVRSSSHLGGVWGLTEAVLSLRA